MPNKNSAPNRRGPGSARQDRQHSEKGRKAHDAPAPGAPTSGRKSVVSGGGGEGDKRHTHEDQERS